MARKVYQGTTNDKERSMQKLIMAVGEVISIKGYKGLTPTNIAKTAGLDRRLITLYFGTVDHLVETYVKSKDYWLSAAGNATALIKANKGNDTKTILESILNNQLDYFYNSQEMQKVVLWQISERTALMSAVSQESEEMSKSFFALSDIELRGENIDLRAVSALLVAGIYYLVLHANSTDSLFCEIDLNTENGMNRIKKAISLVLENTYKN